MRTSRLAAVTLVIAAALLAGGVGPASAGGGWLYPVEDEAEPGDIVTFVGYVDRGTQGWVEDGPFAAYLRPATEAPVERDEGIPLGLLAIEEAPGGRTLRVSVGVWLPAGLEPGGYQIGYCDVATCTMGLGDLIGSQPFAVGVPAVRPIERVWPLTEPEIANLAPDAVVAGPGYRFTAAQIRAGATAALPPTVTVSLPAPAIFPGEIPASAPASVAGQPAQVSSLRSTGGREANPALLLLGIVIAAVCTASVLLALRRSGPASPPAVPAGA